MSDYIKRRKNLLWTPGALFFLAQGAKTASAQVPPAIEAELRKLGQVVSPACTAKLYRPLLPANDYNTYWPPDAAAPGPRACIHPGLHNGYLCDIRRPVHGALPLKRLSARNPRFDGHIVYGRQRNHNPKSSASLR